MPDRDPTTLTAPGGARIVRSAGGELTTRRLRKALAGLMTHVRHRGPGWKHVLFWNTFNHVDQTDRIRDADFANFGRIRQAAPAEANAAPLAEFLSVPEVTARSIAETPHLFAD